MDVNITPKDIHVFQTKRSMTQLFKGFLTMLEDLNQDIEIPPAKFAYLRKRIFDQGNDAIRGWEEHVKNFDISFGTKES